jgi:hypothetical protein
MWHEDRFGLAIARIEVNVEVKICHPSKANGQRHRSNEVDNICLVLKHNGSYALKLATIVSIKRETTS